jgi:bleomycin hydrolase
MKKTLLIFIALCSVALLSAQIKDVSSAPYNFKVTTILPSTPVKNQAVTGTCWSFTVKSFFESELLRKGKGEHNLSEMFSVRYNYINRVNDNYLKLGKGNLAEGSLNLMALNVMDSYGMVPEEVYTGINYDSKTHNHRELNSFINAIAQVPIDLKTKSPEYTKLLNSLLDIYLGPVPDSFSYRGKVYTPKSFFKELDLKTEDYLHLTSFSHHPFYSNFVLEIPDNWNSGRFHNLPLDEFVRVIDYALENGHTVSWGGDMSEKCYSDEMGIAINATKEELASEEGRKLSFSRIYKEEPVTQESRQQGFETFVTTDDHLMHLIGKGVDSQGAVYYIVKNSWKPEINRFGGYNFLSLNYVKAKTVYLMVHKDAIPKW